MNEYYVGTDRHTRAWERNAMISANSLVRTEDGKNVYRKEPVHVRKWIMDSGAFTQITKWGEFVMSPEEYIRLACYFQWCGDLQCIVSQDYMCEPDVIQGLKDRGIRASVRVHQQKTVERYIELLDLADKYELRVPIMPVLQGWEVEDYWDHYCMYKSAFMAGSGRMRWNPAWIGIGSTCKRNKNPEIVAEILDSLEYQMRGYFAQPWMNFEACAGIDYNKTKVHLFGFKTTGLKNSRIKDRIYSADSFAYDFDDKMKGGLRTSEERVKSSIRFHDKIVHNNVQMQLV